MRRISKKGALELSINAIVIVILAMTLLGLGLGFITRMFKNIEDPTAKALEQMKQQIIDEMIHTTKKLFFPTQQIQLEGGDEYIIVIGVKNTEASSLNFRILLKEITKSGTITTKIDVEPDQHLQTRINKYAFFWDDLQKSLDAGESNIYEIKLKADKSAEGTKLFKILITDESAPPVNCASFSSNLVNCPIDECIVQSGACVSKCELHHDNQPSCTANGCSFVAGDRNGNGVTPAGEGTCQPSISSEEYTSKTFFVKFV